MAEFWYYLKKYDDIGEHEFENGSAIKAYKNCDLLSGQESTEQLNRTVKELEGSFFRNLCELLSDYLSVKKKYKNFDKFWSSNKANYYNFFKKEFINLDGKEIEDRYFTKKDEILTLNQEQKDYFDSVYKNMARVKVDHNRSSAYKKDDTNYIFYRDNQYNTYGPKDEPGSTNQKIEKDDFYIQFPMKKFSDTTKRNV